MKKVALLCAALVFSAFANEPEEFEGLLTTPGMCRSRCICRLLFGKLRVRIGRLFS
jgi:hypothetical protein